MGFTLQKSYPETSTGLSHQNLLQTNVKCFNGHGSTRVLKKYIAWAVEDIFGADARRGKIGSRPLFAIKQKYDLDGATQIFPVNSKNFGNVEELKLYPSGSFERAVCVRNRLITYYHTGIFMKNKDKVHILELNAEPGKSNHPMRATIEVNSAQAVLDRDVNSSGAPIRVVNGVYQSYGIDIAKLIHRAARIIGLTVN